MEQKDFEKQAIEEMAKVIDELLVEKPKETTKHAMNVATYLFDRGYCKQSEGKWVHKLTHSRCIPVSCDIICDQCCNSFYRFVGMNYKYCPNCGAKMKGGAE